MLELFVSEERIERSKSLVFLLSFFSVVLSIILSLFIFKDSASFPAVFLAAIAISPTLMAITKKIGVGEISLDRIVIFYTTVFFSMAGTYALVYLIVPDAVNQNLFSAQLDSIQIAFFAFDKPLFNKIFLNNIGLLLVFFLLSFFYGYGSVLLLAWNASILGVLWGHALKNALFFLNSELLISKGLLIWPYLIPEVIAYFLAAIAGGVLYVNISQHRQYNAFMYALKLVIIAILLTLGGAIVEVIILGALN